MEVGKQNKSSERNAASSGSDFYSSKEEHSKVISIAENTVVRLWPNRWTMTKQQTNFQMNESRQSVSFAVSLRILRIGEGELKKFNLR